MSPNEQQKKTTVILPYGKQWITDADKQAVLDVLDSDYLTQGPMVDQFEKALAAYCGARYAVSFSSGTAALHASCAVAGLKQGDHGITSPISFAASSNAMLYCNATVQFADIKASTAQISLSSIVPLVKHHTRVIIPVDLCGRPSELAEIFDFAKKHNITIIQDAAHSLGASYRSRHKGLESWHKVGSCAHADMCCFSFHPVKTITTAEGGAVTTNSEELYKKLVMFRQHGITKSPEQFQHQRFSKNGWYYEMQELGFNYRLSDLQCALGLSQLKTLDERIAKRSQIAKWYVKKLAGEVQFLAQDDESRKSAHHLMPILVDPAIRDEVFNDLRQLGIGVQLHYLPIYRHPYYEQIMPGLSPDKYPAAEQYFRSAISLPIFPQMTENDVDLVVEGLLTILSRRIYDQSQNIWGSSPQVTEAK